MVGEAQNLGILEQLPTLSPVIVDDHGLHLV
jgi:hypothetical protein